ncbi:membrane steroid-binding protein 1-like [Iris pallida]|uniref:Membrane steroid-binding protein 1-like n=1 Tax=Iris pallida TaxID=29817 RepID=A0AAX6HK08_IRIPA|nr:membrane steroid-binding protein 1-like [Iris pallida]
MGATELWQTLEHSIAHYTGLSPAAFFTVLAVALAFYYVVSGLFAAPPPPPAARREVEPEPLAPPVQLGEVDEEELKAYDGSDPKKPLLMAIKGQIYDVTQSRMFYGPGGPYALFAGKDASRALAKMSFEEKDLTGDISGLGPFELDALNDWEYKFMSKYTKVGTIKKAVPVADGSETAEASTQTTDRSIGEGQAEHIAESKEDIPSVNVVKAEDAPADEVAVAKHVADEDAETMNVADAAEAKHVSELKEVAVEDSAKE